MINIKESRKTDVKKIYLKKEKIDEVEREESIKEQEAQESARESRRQMIERNVVKRFLLKQPPRKHTGRKGE